MTINSFVEDLSSLRLENVFNPYSERCEIYNYAESPRNRRNLLKNLLVAASEVDVDSMWIGRDLGYRGGRRTGLALTDDVHLSDHARRWDVDCRKFTKGTAVPERTAAVIWSAVRQIPSPIFFWNVFPFHPFESGKPFSNRAHNSYERRIGEEILDEMISIVKPRRLIAIGNDAEKSARRLSDTLTHVKVRHPSYGGQNIFLDQIRSLYGIGDGADHLYG